MIAKINFFYNIIKKLLKIIKIYSWLCRGLTINLHNKAQSAGWILRFF
jgi:hypothetical protein